MTTAEKYNLKIMDGKLSLQPNKSYKGKIIGCLIAAVVCFAAPQLLRLNRDVSMVATMLGAVCLGYAVYDFLFKVNLTYVFDSIEKKVYLKIPGLFSRKLMTFGEAHFLPTDTNGDIYYGLSNKKDKYGRNYVLSDYFSGNEKGLRKQADYEREILIVLDDFVRRER